MPTFVMCSNAPDGICLLLKASLFDLFFYASMTISPVTYSSPESQETWKVRFDAEDLVQKSCARALERVGQLMLESSALSWMFSIVHSVWLNEAGSRRPRSHSHSRCDRALLETIADDAAPNQDFNISMGQVIGAIERLPQDLRVVMLLVPVGTVMSRLFRARTAIGSVVRASKPLA
jgi:RNA polymerase sigma-70 factor (ECF subfamily)